MPITSDHGPRSLRAAMIAPAAKAITCTGSITRRRRNEKRRCRIASGTALAIRRKTIPDIAAAILVTVPMSKKRPSRGAVASARRPKTTPLTRVADQRRVGRLLEAVAPLDDGGDEPGLGDQQGEAEQRRRGGEDAELVRRQQPREDDVGRQVERLGERRSPAPESPAPRTTTPSSPGLRFRLVAGAAGALGRSSSGTARF